MRGDRLGEEAGQLRLGPAALRDQPVRQIRCGEQEQHVARPVRVDAQAVQLGEVAGEAGGAGQPLRFHRPHERPQLVVRGLIGRREDTACIPGFAGHGAEFSALVDRLDEPALTTDLPHTPDATVERQADLLAGLADARGLGDLLVVGHSQGGIVALALAERRPDLIRGLVLLDAPVLVPVPVRTVLRVLLPALLRGPVGRAAMRAFFRGTFTAADPPAFRAEVLERLARTPIEVARTMVASTFGYDAVRRLRASTVPCTYVRANIPTDLAELPPSIRTARIDGAGHDVHVHAADQVAAVVRQAGTTGSEASAAVTASSDSSLSTMSSARKRP